MTVGVVHLMPEVLEFEASADLGTDFPVAFSLAMVGFVIILLVQHVLFAGAECGQAFLTSKADFEAKVVYNNVGEIWRDVIGKYRAPMIMQICILTHVVLESMAVGLAVRNPSYSACLLIDPPPPPRAPPRTGVHPTPPPPTMGVVIR